MTATRRGLRQLRPGPGGPPTDGGGRLADRHSGLRASCDSARVAPTDQLVANARAVGEDRFAAYIAHELRTPLATQRALLELALTDPLADTASWRDVAEDVLDA